MKLNILEVFFVVIFIHVKSRAGKGSLAVRNSEKGCELQKVEKHSSGQKHFRSCAKSTKSSKDNKCGASLL